MTRHVPGQRLHAVPIPTITRPPTDPLTLSSVTAAPPSNTKIKLLPARHEDIPALADLHAESFARDLVFQISRPDLEQGKKNFISAIEDFWNLKGVYFWKAVEVPCEDESRTDGSEKKDNRGTYGGGVDGKLVGLLFYGVSREMNASQSSSRVFAAGHLLPSGSSNTTSTPTTSLADAIRKRFDAVTTSWVKDKDILYVGLLCVAPHSQGKGIGSMLLRIATDLGDKIRVPVWLEATPAGHPLYLARGFHDVKVIEFDLSRWTGEDKGFGMYRYHAMLRLPDPVPEAHVGHT